MGDAAADANTPLTMVRENIEDYPLHMLPDGYRFRTYRDGDRDTWIALHLQAEPIIDITPELFMEQFSSGLDLLPARMFFVETETGIAVASITAWWEKDRYKPAERGRIHWVVVDPRRQGKGIAKAMMTYALDVMRRYHDGAMLGTSSGRLAAVKVYLDFGFVPDSMEMTDPDIVRAWQRVQARLAHPLLAEVLSQYDAAVTER